MQYHIRYSSPGIVRSSRSGSCTNVCGRDFFLCVGILEKRKGRAIDRINKYYPAWRTNVILFTSSRNSIISTSFRLRLLVFSAFPCRNLINLHECQYSIRKINFRCVTSSNKQMTVAWKLRECSRIWHFYIFEGKWPLY